MSKKIVLQLFGILSYALTQWLLLIFLTRFYNIDNAAQYIFYLAFFTPLSIFFSYGLRNGIASDKDERFSFHTYLNISNLGVILYSLSGLFLFYATEGLNLKLFIFTFLLKMNEMISEPYYGRFLRKGASEKYAYSKIYKFILGLFFFFTAWAIEFVVNIPYLSLYGYIFAIYYIFFAFDRSDKIREPNRKIENRVIVGLIVLNFPLALSSFIVALSSSIPKIVFGWQEQGIALAVFGILLYFNAIAVLPITAMTQILFGRSKIEKISYLYKSVIIYSGVFFVFYIFSIPYVLEYIYSITKGYSFKNLVYASLFGVIQIFITLNNFIIIYNRNFKYILYISIVSATLNFVLSILFVDYGLDGVLLSVLLSGIITLILSFIFSLKAFKETRPSIK